MISSEFPPGPGGIGSHAYSLTRALADKGWKMVVFTCGDYATEQMIEEFDRKQSFEIFRFSRKAGLTYVNRLCDVSRYIRKEGGKIVIVSGKFSLWIGLWLRLRLFYKGLYIIGILHGSEVNLPSFAGRKLIHFSMMACNRLVAVSHYTASIVPAWIRKRRKVNVIPNGIDCRRMDQSADETAAVLDLKGTPALLTVGGVSPRKGQHRVIRALPEIIRSYPQVCYHIVGLPVYRKQFEELACRCGVQDHVVFYGVCPSWEMLKEYYKAADLFMLLSENQKNGDVEGFGIVALEAGFFSLPVIGAKGCGIDDAIDDGKSGFLVDGDNATEVREAMEKIFDDKNGFKQRSKVWAEQHDWSIIVEDFIRILPFSKS